MDASELPESPRKRMKVSLEHQAAVNTVTAEIPALSEPGKFSKAQSAHVTKESEVGITDYVSGSITGFRGILKQRYTDFLVNEILPNGKVIHLQRVGLAARDRIEGSTSREQDSKPQEPVVPSAVTKEPVAIDVTAGNSEANRDQIKVKAIEEGTSPVSVNDIAKLMTYFSDETAEQLMSLYNSILADPDKKSRDHGHVKANVPADKTVRTNLHQDIRRIFNSRIESSTDKERDQMTFSAAVSLGSRQPGNQPHNSSQARQRGKLGWSERGGEYLHFSVYKENKDTMEVVSYLARQMQTNAKTFQFAGTKDRRAVTVQRLSAYRIEDRRLAQQNRFLRNSTVGDFEYQKSGLELGDLKGNEFVITLRECDFEENRHLAVEERIESAGQTVSRACQDLHEKGYFNYYGLQRFGTFSTRTDVVGVKLLQGDFQGACEAILHYSAHVLEAAQDPSSNEQISSDDQARAEAIRLFQDGSRSNEALNKLPRKFSAEACIIRHLGRHKTDFAGAIQTIQRNLKLMYVHAYQSLVWNFAVGERWKLFGNNVVEGDLVLVKEHPLKEADEGKVTDEVDADGEVVLQPMAEDRAQGADDIFERARALTTAEASSGNYSISDVVLPLPGFDVLYPTNAMTDFYKTFMSIDPRGGSGCKTEGRSGAGLDPFDMRRKQRDFSLSGSYRKILARIEAGYDVQVRAYKDSNEQFMETDMDKIKRQSPSSSSKNNNGTTANDHDNNASNSNPNPADTDINETKCSPEQAATADKLAVIVKMQLGSSQYATMALRELSKSGIQAYKPDFGGGR